MRLLAYGLRRSLRDGVIAASEGRVDDALACAREYLALRTPAMTREASAADVDAVVLAATCAAVRGDRHELAAIESLLDAGDRPDVVRARTWLGVLGAVCDGEWVDVTAALRGEVPAIVAAFAPSLLVVAAEQAVDRLVTPDRVDEEVEARFRAVFGDRALPPVVRARVRMIQARACLAAGDRTAAIAHLRAVPAEASPLHAFAAALPAGADPLGRCWAALPAADRAGAAGLATAFAAIADSAEIRSLVEVCGDAPAGARDALRTALAAAQVREGHAEDALAELGAPGPNDSNAIRLARAYVALAAGRYRAALAALPAEPTDAGERDLALLAAVGAGDDERLAALLGSGTPPGQRARDAVIRHLAASSSASTWPAWLDDPDAPGEPSAQYAWALLQARRDRPAVAVAAFERALAREPALPATPDVDAARALAARSALAAGDLAGATRYLDAIARPDSEAGAAAEALRVLVGVREAAGQGTELDEPTLGRLVRELHDRTPPGPRRDAIARLASATDELWARWLLRHGRVDEARGVVARIAERLRGRDPARAAFYVAVLAVFEGRPLDDCERALLAAHAMPNSDPLLGVLVAEVRGARGDEAGRTAALAALPASEIVTEARAYAETASLRGLDAKRAAIAELRRVRDLGRPALATAFAARLGEALGWELPPPRRTPGGSAGAALGADTLAARAPLLAELASTRAAHAPAHREAIEQALERFTQALAQQDAGAALAAERAVLRACRDGGA